MAFEGSLEDLSLVDVLQLLHVTRNEGVLWLEGPGGRSTLSLKDGFIVSASHPRRDMTVGQILIQMGAVTEEQVNTALVAQNVAPPHERSHLIALLHELGFIDQAVGWNALERLIEETVVEVLSWKNGSFRFDVVPVETSDSFRHMPEGMSYGVEGVDIQQTLLDAMQIIDERSREISLRPETPSGPVQERPTFPGDDGRPTDVSEVEAAELAAMMTQPKRHRDSTLEIPATSESMQHLLGPDAEGSSGMGDWHAQLRSSPLAPMINPAAGLRRRSAVPEEDSRRPSRTSEMFRSALAPPTDVRRPSVVLPEAGTARMVVLFCRENLLKHSIKGLCREEGIEILVAEQEQDVFAAFRQHTTDGGTPLLVVDLSADANGVAWANHAMGLVQRLYVSQPEADVIALCEPNASAFGGVFDLGVRASLPRVAPATVGNEYAQVLKETLQALRLCLRAVYGHRRHLAEELTNYRHQMGMLRQRVQDIRVRGESPEISLGVMRYLAEFVDRSLIFLCRDGWLMGLGAFGLSCDASVLPQTVMSLKIPVTNESLLGTVMREGRVFWGTCDDATLRDHLYEKIGAPSTSEVLLLPLRAEERAVALVYGDCVNSEAGRVDVDALELLATQAGFALELAFTRRRLAEISLGFGRGNRGEEDTYGQEPAAVKSVAGGSNWSMDQ